MFTYHRLIFHLFECCVIGDLLLDDRLRHRGPDWSGLHCFEDCYLAHQRLAIVDPTSGDQPLYNEDKTIIVTVNFFPHFVYDVIALGMINLCNLGVWSFFKTFETTVFVGTVIYS